MRIRSMLAAASLAAFAAPYGAPVLGVADAHARSPGFERMGARFVDLPTGAAQGSVRVEIVDPNGAAHRAGLRAGDVVVALDDRVVSSAASLVMALDDKPNGAAFAYTVVRDGRLVQGRGTVGEGAAAAPARLGDGVLSRGVRLLSAVDPTAGGAASAPGGAAAASTAPRPAPGAPVRIADAVDDKDKRAGLFGPRHDLHPVALDRGSYYRVTLKSGADLLLEVHPPNERSLIIAAGDSRLARSIVVAPAQGGDHVLRVSGAKKKGAYELVVEEIPAHEAGDWSRWGLLMQLAGRTWCGQGQSAVSCLSFTWNAKGDTIEVVGYSTNGHIWRHYNVSPDSRGLRLRAPTGVPFFNETGSVLSTPTVLTTIWSDPANVTNYMLTADGALTYSEMHGWETLRVVRLNPVTPQQAGAHYADYHASKARAQAQREADRAMFFNALLAGVAAGAQHYADLSAQEAEQQRRISQMVAQAEAAERARQQAEAERAAEEARRRAAASAPPPPTQTSRPPSGAGGSTASADAAAAAEQARREDARRLEQERRDREAREAQQKAEEKRRADEQRRAQEEARRRAEEQQRAERQRLMGMNASGSFSTVGLQPIAPGATPPGSGRLSMPVSHVGGCKASNVTVQYTLNVLMGEPTVGGTWWWSGEEGCTAPASTVVWLKLQSGTAFGWVRLDPAVPAPNRGTGFNPVSSSPDWPRVVCGFSGSQPTGCMDERSAKQMWANGQVVGFMVGW